jgi:hypothetical protein
MATSKDMPLATWKLPLPLGTILGATAGLLIPLAAVALLFWTTRSTPTEDALSLQQKLRELQAAEEQQLTSYAWVEKPGGDKPGVVRIPIQRARELILSEMAAGKKESKR